MKITGIVRRIDDLGRVVIPKEIRRTLHLQEGTPLEISTNKEGETILKKYSSMMELATPSGQYAEAMTQSTGMIACTADRDQVIAVSGGSKRDMIQKTISRQLEYIIGERNVATASKDDKASIPLTSDEMEGIAAQVIVLIICEGDATDSVALLSKGAKAKFGGMEVKLVLTTAAFLGRQMETQDKQTEK